MDCCGYAYGGTERPDGGDTKLELLLYWRLERLPFFPPTLCLPGCLSEGLGAEALPVGVTEGGIMIGVELGFHSEALAFGFHSEAVARSLLGTTTTSSVR